MDVCLANFTHSRVKGFINKNEVHCRALCLSFAVDASANELNRLKKRDGKKQGHKTRSIASELCTQRVQDW